MIETDPEVPPLAVQNRAPSKTIECGPFPTLLATSVAAPGGCVGSMA